jgi:hypothetical protein
MFGAQMLRLAHIDVNNLGGASGGIPVNKDANTALQAAGHIHFVAAEQGRIDPAKLAGGQGGKFGI